MSNHVDRTAPPSGATSSTTTNTSIRPLSIALPPLKTSSSSSSSSRTIPALAIPPLVSSTPTSTSTSTPSSASTTLTTKPRGEAGSSNLPAHFRAYQSAKGLLAVERSEISVASTSAQSTSRRSTDDASNTLATSNTSGIISLVPFVPSKSTTRSLPATSLFEATAASATTTTTTATTATLTSTAVSTARSVAGTTSIPKAGLPPLKYVSTRDRGSAGPGVRSSRAILVSRSQEGNPVLKYVRNAVWEYYEPSRAMNTASSKKPGNETVGALDAGRRPRPSIPPEDPDFILSPTTCALFISLKYHLLHPSYLLHRINHLKSSHFSLKICLAVVDVEDSNKAICQITKLCIHSHFTLILSWSSAEAARYLETFKVYENKPADFIQGKVENSFRAKMTDCLTSIRAVNKTDVGTLLNNIGSLKSIMTARVEELLNCPGLGERKVQLLIDTFNQPFKRVPMSATSTVTTTTSSSSSNAPSATTSSSNIPSATTSTTLSQ